MPGSAYQGVYRSCKLRVSLRQGSRMIADGLARRYLKIRERRNRFNGDDVARR